MMYDVLGKVLEINISSKEKWLVLKELDKDKRFIAFLSRKMMINKYNFEKKKEHIFLKKAICGLVINLNYCTRKYWEVKADKV